MTTVANNRLNDSLGESSIGTAWSPASASGARFGNRAIPRRQTSGGSSESRVEAYDGEQAASSRGPLPATPSGDIRSSYTGLYPQTTSRTARTRPPTTRPPTPARPPSGAARLDARLDRTPSGGRGGRPGPPKSAWG